MYQVIAKAATTVNPDIFAEHRTLPAAIRTARGLYHVIKHVRKHDMLKKVIQVQILNKDNQIVMLFGSI